MIPGPDGLPNILGFLIRDTRGDIFEELLELEPGLTVLYGLNGAGKTRTLDDIRRFWDGVAADCMALVQLPDWSGFQIDWQRQTDRGDWYPDWGRRAGTTVGSEADILSAWLETVLEADEIDLFGVEPRGNALERRRELISEWLDQRLILVLADGTANEKRWFSVPAFLTGSQYPATLAEVELYDLIAGREAWDPHGSEPYLTPVGITGDGRTIACANVYGIPALDPYQMHATAAQHDRLIDLSVSLHGMPPDINERTRRHLSDRISDTIACTADKPRPSSNLIALTQGLENGANKHYSGVLHDAPTLRLHVDPIGFGQQVDWFVEIDEATYDPHDVERGSPITFDEWERRRQVAELSSAQRRWALWSIEMALQEGAQTDGPQSRLILLDEPEAALHRSAEARMAEYVAGLATDGSTQLLLATHSPELLDLDTARVYEVTRRGSQRHLSRLTSVARENLDALGLLPSDLLRRQRGFILVEGLHDELVLEGLFGPELRRLRVEILPLRGTSELSPAKIAFLLDYTPAHVFILLDNVVTTELSDAWGRALDLVTIGRLDDAQAALSAAACLKTDEGTKLSKVLKEVLLNGHGDRLTPFGLTQADIIEYLPTTALVPGEEKWHTLREQHGVERQATKGTARDFKAWLRQSRGADFSAESVRAAVQGLGAIPPDLLRLLKTVEAHVQRNGTRSLPGLAP